MAQAVADARSEEAAATAKPGRPWLFGPGIDLLFVANIAWPVILLGMLSGGLEIQGRVSFWQIYFVTTPHRWITLLIVFADRDRFRERPRAFLGVAAVVAAVSLGVRVSTGTLTCLLAIDFAWNAWHFAAQHHGIFRIYGRMSQPERTSGMTAEKGLMRFFVLYAAFRTATWAWLPNTASWMKPLDFAVLAVPLWLLAREFAAFDRRAIGRVSYLISFCFLYSGLLLSLNRDRPALVLMFTTAGALFHAVEYLAVVSWSVRSRHGRPKGRETLFARLLPQWALAMAVFVSIIGIGGWLISHELLQQWLLLNVIVAFLHYTYDGMIWKSKRRPQSVA
jgi:hypothetical protein